MERAIDFEAERENELQRKLNKLTGKVALKSLPVQAVYRGDEPPVGTKSSAVIDLDVGKGHGVVLAVPSIPPLGVVPLRREANQRHLFFTSVGVQRNDHDEDDDEGSHVDKTRQSNVGPCIFGDRGDLTAEREKKFNDEREIKLCKFA